MRISDWSSDVCSSDLADRRQLNEDNVAELLLSVVADADRCLVAGNHHPLVVLGVTLLAHALASPDVSASAIVVRSEERRVGKECVSTCRSRWSPYHYKKKNISYRTIM